MRIARKIIRVLMLLGTLGISIGTTVLGIIQAAPTGFLGAPNTDQTRLTGYIFIAVGILMLFFSFFLLKKKNLVPFCIVLGALFLGLIAGGMKLVITYTVVPPYTVFMILGYIVDHILGKTAPKSNSEDSKLSEKKVDKILAGIPIVIIIFGWIYISYGQYWIEDARTTSKQKATFSNLEYKLVAAKYIPRGYTLKETRLGGRTSRYFYAEYRNKNREYFMLSQFKKPKSLRLEPPRCSIYGDSKGSFEIVDIYGSTSGINTSCEVLTTPGGRKIYVMSYKIDKQGNYAVTTIGNTLVTVTGYIFPQAELIKLVDSIEEKNPDVKAPNQKY